MDISDFLSPADWSFPVPIHYGPGRIRELGQIARSCGMERPLIVTDRASRDLPFVTAALNSLTSAGLEPAIFSEVSPNPTDQDALAGLVVLKRGRHDGVIALGGGSGMDGAKAISLLASCADDLWAFDYDGEVQDNLNAQDFPPLITIPTTAGTGAETESTAMVTDTVQMTKRCVWHPTQKPRAVILDPELTVGLPRNLTAWTGCDALVHAIEAYSVPANHPLCDGAALQALGLIAKALPDVLDNPSSIEARGAMLVGSCLAGIAFLKGLGLVHSISHVVGAEKNTHHGLTNAVLLPTVLAYNAPDISAKIGPMCQAMGLKDEHYASFISAILSLLDRCDIPQSLSALGVTEGDVDRLAKKAFLDAATGTNPRAASPEDIAGLIRTAMADARGGAA